MITAFRWSLCCIFLLGIFLAGSVFGQSTETITAEGAEFNLSESLGGDIELQNTVSELLPSFVTGRNSEFMRKLTWIIPDRALAESAHPHISVRGAEFVDMKVVLDPSIIIELSLEYCQIGLGYSTIEQLKDNLEKRAKQIAANELLDTQIRSITGLASCNLTRDDVMVLLTDRIKISEDPIYSNDKTIFAAVCISISPYVEEESITDADLTQIADDVCRKPAE